MSNLSRAQENFIKKILHYLDKNVLPWRATWDTPLIAPYNEANHIKYQGMNQFNLYLTALANGWNDGRWMTFKQAKEKGYRIKKGSVGTDVFHFAIRNQETQKIIEYKEYLKLSKEEQKEYMFVSKSYRVFNGTQIDGLEQIQMKEVQFENDKAKAFVDTLHQQMNITIQHGDNRAFYHPRQDYIQMPEMSDFMNEESYYATLLHESAHATGHETRLNREVSNAFANEKYALEELRAEITSAFLSMDLGFHFNEFDEENHIAYIQHWNKKIKENPKVIFDAIRDAQKIREYMLEKGEYTKIYAQANETIENHSMGTGEVLEKAASTEELQFAVIQEKADILEQTIANSSMKKQTLVINLFAGPGAGKTTCAWEIASQLKKMNYIVEYVPEYAKELVWDEKRELLDGSLEHQKMLLNEQQHRVKRLIGKVDFVVTDAPSLINLNFLKETDSQKIDAYKMDVLSEFNQNHNFNLFIQRGNHYEQEGRVHTLKQSLELDDSLQKILKENRIYYGTYHHKNVDTLIANAVTTFEKLNQVQKVEVDVLEETMPTKPKKNRNVDLEKIKNAVSIAEYARDILGLSLVKESRGLFRIEEYDSCKIYPNNTFYRFSNGIGGSIIDFIKEFEQVDLLEAIDKANAYQEEHHGEIRFDTKNASKQTFNPKNVRDLITPEKAETANSVSDYLIKKRMIHPQVVRQYLDRKILYEDINKNCVFLSKYQNVVSYGHIISTSKKFRQDISGSIKELGIYVNNNSNVLVVNEAVIDQMSYMTLAPHPEKFDYLSTQGAANALPAIRFHLIKREEGARINKVVLALDNDVVGERNAIKVIDFLKNNYPEIECCIHLSEGKDFNEQLQKEVSIMASVAPNNDVEIEMI